MKPRVLIIEDDETVRSQLEWALAEDYDILVAEDRPTAVDSFRANRPEVSVLDLGLPPHIQDPSEGLAVLADIRSLDRGAKVIVVTGLTGKETDVRAAGEGACYFLQKPVQIPELKFLIRHCEHMGTLERKYHELQHTAGGETFQDTLGCGLLMRDVFASVGKVAPQDTPLLLMGERGAGKDVIARAIHQQSGRRAAPFVMFDCSALPEDLVESELFGKERDPVTGAHLPQHGRIELASGGTLFLDEVGDLSPRLQVKLLRYLQEQVVERVGGSESIRLNTRIIAGTSADLARAMPAARFRDDLYYKLAVVVIRIPALRERKDDIRFLAQGFLKRFTAQYGKPQVQIAPTAWRAMEQYPWPGNVCELENCVRRAVIMSEGDFLEPPDFDLQPQTAPAQTGGLREVRQNAERECILRTLRRHHNRIAPAAEELGISRPTFYALMEKLGIPRGNTPPDNPS